jgi:uncharacterized membrane protein YoaK (UPF0700 family)
MFEIRRALKRGVRWARSLAPTLALGYVLPGKWSMFTQDQAEGLNRRRGIPRKPLMGTNSIAMHDRLRSDRGLRDWLLFMLTVSSGAVDTISFLALGKVFTAFMTGNLAFLGMGIAGNAGAPSSVAVLVSMAGFAGGVYLATLIVTPRRTATDDDELAGAVWRPRITYALALSLLPHLGFVLLWIATGGSATLGLLAIWALAMGMQSAAVRLLDVGGVFTTAATATFIFLFGSFAGHPLTGEERLRLLGVLSSLIIGATAGGLMLIYASAYAPLLPLLITIGVVTIAAKAFGYRLTIACFPSPLARKL